MTALVQSSEPQPELGPVMRALPLRWQRAVSALFVTKGNRSAALRAAGYKAKPNSLHVIASRVFADDSAALLSVSRMISSVVASNSGSAISIMRAATSRTAARTRFAWLQLA